MIVVLLELLLHSRTCQNWAFCVNSIMWCYFHRVLFAVMTCRKGLKWSQEWNWRILNRSKEVFRFSSLISMRRKIMNLTLAGKVVISLSIWIDHFTSERNFLAANKVLTNLLKKGVVRLQLVRQKKKKFRKIIKKRSLEKGQKGRNFELLRNRKVVKKSSRGRRQERWFLMHICQLVQSF